MNFGIGSRLDISAQPIPIGQLEEVYLNDLNSLLIDSRGIIKLLDWQDYLKWF